MKVFDLVCTGGHRFEGWFASAESFEAQHASSSVRCPICDARDVQRSPSAPRLNLGAEATQASEAQALMPVLFNQLRRLVGAAENVGANFAAEARRIHHDEAPARSIRGTATDAERRALEEEGIETFTLPALPALTETLQ
jgi:hypothetical protein